MGDTWITDMSHFDYNEEEAHRVPNRGKRLAEYLASIIERTVKRAPMDGNNVGIRCRRRPGRRPCTGVLQSEMHPHGNELRWWCPVCGDNGRISNWVGTRWEPKKERIYPLIYSKLQEMAQEKQKARTDTEKKDRVTIEGDVAPDSPLSDTMKEVVTGQINWDEEKSELGLSAPKIVTTDKEYTWEELGEKLMEYEGWRIKIEVF